MEHLLQRALRRHRERRAQGIPTVSWLVGPTTEAAHAWTEVEGGICVAWQDREHALRQWWGAAEGPLRNALLQHAALALGRRPGDIRLALATASSSERSALLDALAAQLRDVHELVVPLLGDEPLGDRREPPLQAAVRLVAPPGLCIEADAPVALAFAAQLAEDCRALPLAVVSTRELPLETLDERARHLLREGIVRMPPPPPRDLPADLAAVVARHGSEVARTAAWIHAAAPQAALAILFAEAADAVAAAHEDGAVEARARSAAELFLYRCFEACPALAGRFELNGRLQPGDAQRPLEVDLLARADGLAVEVDGYFHFREPADYRRDRRKDWALQRQGYAVLRWLAGDVVVDLEAILATVVDALAWRRAEGGHGARTA